MSTEGELSEDSNEFGLFGGAGFQSSQRNPTTAGNAFGDDKEPRRAPGSADNRTQSARRFQVR